MWVRDRIMRAPSRSRRRTIEIQRATMTDIATLAEEYSLAAASLTNRGVLTLDDLWACVSKDVDTGVTQVVATTGISQEVLLAFLIAETLEGARQSNRPKPFGQWFGVKPLWHAHKKFSDACARLWRNRRQYWLNFKEYRLGLDMFWVVPKLFGHRLKSLWLIRKRVWPDIVLITLPLIIIGLAVRARFVNRRQVSQVVVRQGASLTPFSSVDPKDLTTESRARQSDTFASIEEIGKRYSLRQVTSGEFLRSDQLVTSKLSDEMDGRQILSIPVKAGTFNSGLKPPAKIRLMLSPREKTTAPAIVDDVILLVREKQGDSESIIIAVKDDAPKIMGPLLGVSDVFVLWPIR